MMAGGESTRATGWPSVWARSASFMPSTPGDAASAGGAVAAGGSEGGAASGWVGAGGIAEAIWVRDGGGTGLRSGIGGGSGVDGAAGGGGGGATATGFGGGSMNAQADSVTAPAIIPIDLRKGRRYAGAVDSCLTPGRPGWDRPPRTGDRPET